MKRISGPLVWRSVIFLLIIIMLFSLVAWPESTIAEQGKKGTWLPFDILEILKLGASGLSFLFLYFGYLVINKVISITERDDTYKQKMILAICFMLVSVIIFFGGIFGQYWVQQQKNDLYVILSPPNLPGGVGIPKIRHGKVIKEFEKDGSKTIEVRNNDLLIFQIDNLIDKLVFYKSLLPNAPKVANSVRR